MEAGTRLALERHLVTVASHPSAPRLPYAQEGRIATVYQVVEQATARKYALKVYRDQSTFRRVIANEPLLHSIVRPGLDVAAFERVQGPATREWPELNSAILMPWIDGSSWQDVIVDGQELPAERLVAVAQHVASVLAWLESRRLTHGDVCGANLLMRDASATSDPGLIELVDLDQVSDVTSIGSMTIAAGSPGYVPERVDFSVYKQCADRCAGGILIAEIIGWSDPIIRSASHAETYFAPSEPLLASRRYDLMNKSLDDVCPPLAVLLDRLWTADEPPEWPTLEEWQSALTGFTAKSTTSPTPRRKEDRMLANAPDDDGSWEKQTLSSWQAKTLGETRSQGLGSRALLFTGVGVAGALLVMGSGLFGFQVFAALGQPLTYAVTAAALAVVAAVLNVWFYRRAFSASEIPAIASRISALAGAAAFFGGLAQVAGVVPANGLIGLLAGSVVAWSLTPPSPEKREYRIAVTLLIWIGAWVLGGLADYILGGGSAGSAAGVLIVLGGIGGLTALFVGATPDVEF